MIIMNQILILKLKVVEKNIKINMMKMNKVEKKEVLEVLEYNVNSNENILYKLMFYY